MKASIIIRVDPEALATLLKRTEITAPHAALRKILGLPPSTVRKGRKAGTRVVRHDYVKEFEQG